ncbi:hypothetical protein [Acinetobacter phage AB1I1M-1]
MRKFLRRLLCPHLYVVKDGKKSDCLLCDKVSKK